MLTAKCRNVRCREEEPVDGLWLGGGREERSGEVDSVTLGRGSCVFFGVRKSMGPKSSIEDNNRQRDQAFLPLKQ